MKIIKIIGLVFLIWIGYTAYLWIASAKEIEHVCSQIQAGQSKQEVIGLIQAGKYLLHIESKFGPHVVHGIIIYSRECHAKVRCLVDFDGGMVTQSEMKGS